LFYSVLVYSQVLCPGKVVDFKTGLPVRDANIFLAGTLIGTTSDSLGVFEIDTKGNFSIPLVISVVGYENKIMSIANILANPTIQLEKTSIEIADINVKSEPGSWTRKRMLKVFYDEFIGSSFNAKSCKIKNEEDIYLYYNSASEVLFAHSKSPLIIENKMLGYKILYLLESFKKSSSGVNYKGYSAFIELESKTEAQRKKIELNRKDAYTGSIMHFMRYLYDYNIADPDTVYNIRLVSMSNYYVRESIQIISEKEKVEYYDPENMDTIQAGLPLEADVDAIFNQFHLHDSVGNYLTKKPILKDAENVRKLCSLGKIRVLYYPKFMSSYLVPKTDCIEISENGYYDPDLIGWRGSMGKLRVGDLLPFDYEFDSF
jgi:hypothetical protein